MCAIQIHLVDTNTIYYVNCVYAIFAFHVMSFFCVSYIVNWLDEENRPIYVAYLFIYVCWYVSMLHVHIFQVHRYVDQCLESIKSYLKVKIVNLVSQACQGHFGIVQLIPEWCYTKFCDHCRLCCHCSALAQSHRY